MPDTPLTWRARGEKARALADLVSRKDMETLRSYADECEIRAFCIMAYRNTHRRCKRCPMARRGSC